MAFIHGKSAVVLYGGYILSAYFNEASASRSVETAETTAFGNNAKTYITGLADGTASLSGMFDGDAGAVDVVLSAQLGSSTDVPATIAVDGIAAGKRVMILNSIATSYEISSPVGDVVSATAELQADGGINTAISLTTYANSDKNGVSTTSYDGGASSSNGGIGQIHVTANTLDGVSTFKIQHSADNSTWADLATFATVASATVAGARVTVASGTTVNRYLRINHASAGSTTGSITFTGSFVRL